VIYTGSGLWRVKPYIQFGGGIMWRAICPPPPPEEGVDDDMLQAALYWLECLGLQVGFHLSYTVTIWKAYPNYLKLSGLSCLVHQVSSWAHMSGRVGSTDRLADLLVGRACLSGTAETVVIGDPFVPMSHKPPIDV
jgi:hypothetical protein